VLGASWKLPVTRRLARNSGPAWRLVGSPRARERGSLSELLPGPSDARAVLRSRGKRTNVSLNTSLPTLPPSPSSQADSHSSREMHTTYLQACISRTTPSSWRCYHSLPPPQRHHPRDHDACTRHSAFAFQRCFRPLYCFSSHCTLGDTAHHHTLSPLLSCAAFDHFIAFHRTAPSETQHFNIPSSLQSSRTAFDRTIAFHRIAFSETQHVTIPFRLCFLALLSTTSIPSPHHISGDTAHHHTHSHLLSCAAFNRIVSIALHFPTETQNVMHNTSTLRYPIFVLLFFRAAFCCFVFTHGLLFWLYP
jgi:hypothetical protein